MSDGVVVADKSCVAVTCVVQCLECLVQKSAVLQAAPQAIPFRGPDLRIAEHVMMQTNTLENNCA